LLNGGLVLLLEDLLNDVLALLNQVLNVLLDFGLVLALEAFQEFFEVFLSFLHFGVVVNLGQTEVLRFGVFFFGLFLLILGGLFLIIR
jgi:hypothetical protein